MDCAYHPGKEAVVACVNCGKLICLECKTELGGKNYCPPCADEIFVAREPRGEAATAPPQPPAPGAKKPAEASETPTTVDKKTAAAKKTAAGVREMPAGATKGPGEAAEGPVGEQKISGAWWLMPVFLTWVGGLVAWLVNKDKSPRRSKSMLIWGIILTFLYPAIWWLGLWLFALALGASLQLSVPW